MGRNQFSAPEPRVLTDEEERERTLQTWLLLWPLFWGRLGSAHIVAHLVAQRIQLHPVAP